MRLDLHVHSYASDGRVSPTDLVRAAEAGRLDVVAVTDHDTVTGVAEALAAARDRPLQVVPGIEISTREPEGEFHVLGLFVDPRSPALLAHQAQAATRRRARMHAMVERLRDCGVPVTFEDVLSAAEGEPASLGRPHLARALVAGRHVRSFGEAFERYLRDGGPAFVPTEFPAVSDAVDAIHAAGGVAIWAHPPMEWLDLLLSGFAEIGMSGVECFRPNNSAEDELRLRAAARRSGLFPSGGSDWHGPHHGPLGQFHIEANSVPELASMCALAGAEPGRTR